MFVLVNFFSDIVCVHAAIFILAGMVYVPVRSDYGTNSVPMVADTQLPCTQ
eukprot:m.1051860 g.1051860  ORF g.1051860 m.1051860 type:complete len:51 (-) comp24180_c2_seq11:1871-2023(-)